MGYRDKHAGGRPYKGPRDQFIVRPTVPVGERIRKEAEELDVAYTDVCARILAEHYGLPATNDIAPAQEQLRMTG